jgi:hypothetical protein
MRCVVWFYHIHFMQWTQSQLLTMCGKVLYCAQFCIGISKCWIQ